MNRSATASGLSAGRKDFFYWQSISTRWGDNDIYGHVNNAVYFTYIDSVVNQFLIEKRLIDIQNGDLIGLVVSSQCQFFAPLNYPGRVDCGLRVDRIGNSSVTYSVGLFAHDNDEAVAIGGFTHVYVKRDDRRPCALPDGLRSALEKLVWIEGCQ